MAVLFSEEIPPSILASTLGVTDGCEVTEGFVVSVGNGVIEENEFSKSETLGILADAAAGDSAAVVVAS